MEEETGFQVSGVQRIFQAFMSPGSVTGNVEEGEDIEVLEVSIDDALTAIESGAIQDGKTIMLLQYAALHLFAEKGSST